MSKGKSVFVTALVAVMLAAIIVGLFEMESKAFIIIAGFFGIYGFIGGAFGFCSWLRKEQPLLPPPQQLRHRQEEPDDVKVWQPDPDWTDTIDRIKAELDDGPPQVESNHEIMGYEK